MFAENYWSVRRTFQLGWSKSKTEFLEEVNIEVGLEVSIENQVSHCSDLWQYVYQYLPMSYTTEHWGILVKNISLNNSRSYCYQEARSVVILRVYEDTTYFSHRTWKNQSDFDLDTTCIRTNLHSIKWCYTHCQGKKENDSHIQL